MKNQTPDITVHTQASMRVVSRFHSQVLRHYVASKLRTDPVYPTIYELIRRSTEPVLDVGCGMGLLAFYLRERGLPNPIIGLDRDQRKIREAHRIAEAYYRDLIFREHDVRDRLLPFSGNVVVLDLLHYLSPENQKRLLRHLADQVVPGAIIALRDCPRDSSARFWFTHFAEKIAQGISWNVAAPLHFPSRESICENFRTEEFNRETKPLWGRTPFNNHLFIFQRCASVTARIAE